MTAYSYHYYYGLHSKNEPRENFMPIVYKCNLFNKGGIQHPIKLAKVKNLVST